MSEKLIIRNFGPINTVELDLRRVNILIGDQGTGKSTTAKILATLKNVINQNSGELDLSVNGKYIEAKAEIQKIKNENFKNDFFNEIESLDIKNYLNEKTYICFENDSNKVIIDNFQIQFEDKNRLDKKNTNLNYYIPAYREAYILLRNNYPAILNAKANLPAILNIFGQAFNNYREKFRYFDFKNIIGVDYVFNNLREFIVLKDGREISFEESSSAVNSVVPMLVVFLGIVGDMSAESPRVYHYRNCPFITIEEPELNCFPSTQNELVKFIIENLKFKDYQKSKEYYCNLIITTHSPYILTSLNNLMFAYQSGQNNEEDINKIIDKKYWVNPADVSAYMMLPNGECESIIDREGLIKTEKIDNVSGTLNKEFNEMFDIELAIKK